MSIVKEYIKDKTKIRIHDDYIDKEEQKMAKEMIISMIINFLKKEDI